MSLERNIKFNDDNSITIDGIKYIPEKRHTGIEEPAKHQTIYYCDKGCAMEDAYNPSIYGYDYLIGQITTDKQLAIDRERATRIRFALEKYAAEHNTEPIDWTDSNSYKYRIVYDSYANTLRLDGAYCTKHDAIYFDSGQTAKNAIEAVGEEDVLWLYRDYQPYLNAFKVGEATGGDGKDD